MNELVEQYSQLEDRFVGSIQSAFIDESISTLRVFETRIRSKEDIKIIQDFGDLLAQNNFGNMLIEGDIVGEVSLRELKLEKVLNEEVRFVINKEEKDFIYFFTLQGFVQFLWKDNDLYKYNLIYLNQDFKAFSTYTNHYVSLKSFDANYQIDKKVFKGLTDPRVLVRDRASGPNSLPENVSSWFLTDFEDDSQVLTEWKKIASFKLSVTLPLQIIDDEGNLYAVFKDENYYSFKLKSKDSFIWTNLYDDIYEVSYWIYKNKEESESKHRLLNHQLAIEWPEDVEFPNLDRIPRTLSNAKRAYDLHLHDSSKEVLKSLTELRKILFEEVEKVKEVTRSLSERLWRDFAIALGVIVIRFVPNVSNIPIEILDVLSYGTAIFLLLSIIITIGSNFFFNKTAKSNREKWRNRLFFYISKVEFDEIYQSHINSSLYTFRFVQGAITVIYLVLATFLFLLGYCDIHLMSN